MIWYAIVSGILLYCFEIIGRYVLSILKIERFKCCFGIGLILFLAYSYVTTSLITSSNGSFYVVSVIYSLFFIVFFILIIKDRKKILFSIDLVNAILMVVFIFVMCLYTYNTTLGALDGFDTTFYLNFVTSNVKSNSMNYAYYSNSLEQSFISKQYTFQTFYYIASFFSYIISSIICIFHKTYYQTVYIWVFQILFDALFYSLISNSLSLMMNRKKDFISLFILLFFLLVYGRIYYYNVFGFYGNTYRIVTVGYSTLLLYLLTKSNRNNGLMLLFMMSLLASASVSSSSLFIDVFILFGAYFILCNKYNDILKYYSIPLFFILTNLISVAKGLNTIYSILISFIIATILFTFGNKINSVLSKKKLLIIMLSISIAFMFIASLAITKNLFDFSAFLYNHSESSDMTINYFNLGTMKNYLLLKLFVLGLLITSLFSVKKEKIIQFTIILFLCVFNPFCCPFLYKVLIVYFRAFDIIVNPFTIVLYIHLLLDYFKNKTYASVVLCIIICIISFQRSPLNPLYYHDSFIPEHNADGVNYVKYDKEYKMSQDEKETIDVIYDDVMYYKKTNPYIITPSLLTQGFITDGRYFFVRTKPIKYFKNHYEKQLYAIFFPERYFGDRVEGIVPDYNRTKEYIDEAQIDYLVVDKTKEYFDENLNDYICLHTKVSEFFYPMFENDRYIVYRCFYQ